MLTDVTNKNKIKIEKKNNKFRNFKQKIEKIFSWP